MNADALGRYRRLYEELSPADLDRLDRWFAPDARFADPFNDVRGLAAIRAVFAHMFERCRNIRFTVNESAADGDVALLSWVMDFETATGRPWRIEGMSRVCFDADGRVTEHVDHWDAGRQFYERLPVIGWLLRRIRRHA